MTLQKLVLSLHFELRARPRCRLGACLLALSVAACGGSNTAADTSQQIGGAAATSAAPAAGSSASQTSGGATARNAGSSAATSGSSGKPAAAVGGAVDAASVPMTTASAGSTALAGTPSMITGGAGAAGQSTGAAGMPSAGAAGSTVTAPWQWPVGEPEDFGVERAWLDDAADSIQRSTGNRYGMVVVRKGTLIYEKYWDGGVDDKHIVYSCTKSWGSSLIGIAVKQGLLTVKDEVRKWVPMPAQGVSQGATLEHVLTQSAHTNPPGQSFQYNSGYLLNTAPEVLMAAAGVTAHEFFDRYLAKPLNLSMTWPECPKGGCTGTRYPEGFINFGNEPPEAPNKDLPLSSVRDQAKLGWLWANGGKWEGEQLIDPAYLEAGSKPGAGFRAMYGYLMWIQSAEQFGAIGGVGNCYVNVMPSKQLVIAVMGNDTGLGQGGGWSSFQTLANRIPD